MALGKGNLDFSTCVRLLSLATPAHVLVIFTSALSPFELSNCMNTVTIESPAS